MKRISAIRSLILFLLALTFAGCGGSNLTSFFDETPGATCGEKLAVQTSSGDWIVFYGGDARFDTINGKTVLTGAPGYATQPWFDTSHVQEHITIPVSDIRAFVTDGDAVMFTRDGYRFRSERGRWMLIPQGTASWSWQTYNATKRNLNYGPDSVFFNVDTLIARKDISKLEISTGSPAGNILLYWLGIDFIGTAFFFLYLLGSNALR